MKPTATWSTALTAVFALASMLPVLAEDPAPTHVDFATADGHYHFSIDTTQAPELKEWSAKELAPVIQNWYPRIVALLPSDNYTAPTTVNFEYKTDMKGTPAYAAGNKISMNAQWFTAELKREARGSVVHEMTHVVQQYGRGLNGARPAPNPGWIVEGIPDYVRWFLYEPETHGADINAHNIGSAKYDGNYRISANFIFWVVKTKDKDLVKKLNTACRQGIYSPDLWKEWTGKSVEELGAEWKALHEHRIAEQAAQKSEEKK